MDRSDQERSNAAAEVPHAHVMGLDGRGMAGLAQSLAQQGMTVTGSRDGPSRSLDRLRRVGVPVREIAVPRGFAANTRLLVHGPEVGRVHPARLGALRRGIAQATPAAWLREQSRGRLGVVVAGGRVASVAAAMTGLVLEQAGLDPLVVLAAPAPQLGGWSREGAGPYLVADWPGGAAGVGEIRPRLSAFLHVGGDPWVDTERWSAALAGYLREVPEDGEVLALGHPSLAGAGVGPAVAPGRLTWVSLRRGSDWWGTDLREDAGRFRFRVFHRGRFVCEVRLQAPGGRNVVGALAAAAVCERLGVRTEAIRQGLEGFTGLSRDFESRGSYRGVSLVDDEAEGAGPVGDALALARRVFGARRLWAVYAPAGGPGAGEARGFVPAFAPADRVVIAGRGEGEGGGGPEGAPSGAPALARALTDAGAVAVRVASLAEAVAELDRRLEPGDVLLTLGAGDVGTIADAFIRRLPRDRQAG